MMKNVMGIIYTGEQNANLRELTTTRATAALPVIGRYRIIDFIVSSLVHTGVKNVGVITQKNYHSLMDHLGSGKEWDLHGKNDGLFILPPFLSRENTGLYSGMLEALSSNTGYLRRSKQEYVILSNSHFLYNIDFNDLIDKHIERDADLTMVYAHKDNIAPGVHRDDYAYLNIAEDGRVIGIEINPTVPSYPNELLEIYLLRRELLRYLVDSAVANGLHHFRRDVIQRLVNEGGLKVFGHAFSGEYWRIDSVQSYFQMNMALLDPNVRAAVFAPERPVFTKVRDDMAAYYGSNARVRHSLIADGSRIDGEVENSVLFRGVRVEKGAVVRNSIVMQDAQIESGAELNYCILDKQAVIRADGRLIGHHSYPIVIAKNVII
ncbi:MAG: glucose-1-phosphate adenylyltransferase subunit GlgD [Oscillospiraceae bacterium]|jgi:glucose-1-phosphate adenylyltransferase|nr:glucose-1-phosphate adenylyltransferase subunit GlgD [Oscillospiraceae bacterium]